MDAIQNTSKFNKLEKPPFASQITEPNNSMREETKPVKMSCSPATTDLINDYEFIDGNPTAFSNTRPKNRM